MPEGRHHRDNVDCGDAFYPRLLEIARIVDAKIVLFEVADMDQAQRVASMAVNQGIWSAVEIWKDDPRPSETSEVQDDSVHVPGVRVIGSGNGRSVFAWRGEAGSWLAADA